jgi:putative ATP-dependent endonuclease of the OLD family
MKINSLFINNFRGIDNFLIEVFSLNSLIIGKNDAGKTNVCYAIRKILDFDIRKNSFTEADSTNSNRNEITIRIVMSIEGISKENRSILGNSVDKDDTVTVEIVSKYSEDIMQYEDSLFIGTLDKMEYSSSRVNPIDKILDVIYVNPNYNLMDDKNQFFRFRNNEDKENDTGLTSKVAEEVEKLNTVISDEQIVKDINDSLNNQVGFGVIFDKIKFKTQSNISTTNIYKSLEIIPFDDQNAKYNNIGDGKNKTLSLLLKNISKKTGKQKLLIVEEPENHLFPQFQRTYSRLIDSLKFDQAIITTHSPTIVDFNKMKTIIKLQRTATGVEHYSLNFEEDDFGKYGFMLNDDFAQMLFYDKVLLVEGFSEKYFYNRLMIDDTSFLEYSFKHNFGVFSVGSIDFRPYREFLEKLNISVCVKTDNDIFKVPKITPIKYRYAGIERVLNYLSPERFETLKSIIGVSKIDKETFRFDNKELKNPIIEKSIEQIRAVFSAQGVFITAHNQGFEKDFLEFVFLDTQENYNTLIEAKLKNLHSFIQENSIKLKINDANKESVLLGFMNV